MGRILRWSLGLVLAAAACRYEVSFKPLELAGAARDVVFTACRDVVAENYQGNRITCDPVAGRIHTAPVEFDSRGELRRETVFVTVVDAGDGRVQVELLALVEEPRFDVGGDGTVVWRALGSDQVQEQKLLDAIAGRVLVDAPDARVDVRD